MLDRIIQQAIAQVLGVIFDPLFSESSCGFRPGRSAHNGVRQVKQIIGQGYTVAVDTDWSKFFDTANHDVLMVRVSKHRELLTDPYFIETIGQFDHYCVATKDYSKSTIGHYIKQSYQSGFWISILK